jgi:hypothetical protein
MTTTTPTTTPTTSDAANGKELEEDSKKIITIFVKLLPEPNAEEHKNLTRFQVRDPRARYRFGKTCVFRDVEKTTETVLGVKRRVERETGEKVEMLRRGLFRFVSNRERELCSSRSSSFFFLSFRCASVFLYLFHYSIDGDARRPFLISLLSLSLRNKGGTPEGVVLEDEKTLEECGITRSMGLFEYLWVDSKENQEKYKEEKARMFKILPNHEKFMEEYAAEHPGKGDFDALSDEFLEKGAPNKGSKLFKETISDEEYFKDAEKIQAKVERELEEYNAKEDEEREKKFGKEEQE